MLQLYMAECIYKKAWQNIASNKWIWTTYLSYIQFFFEKCWADRRSYLFHCEFCQEDSQSGY